MIQNRLLLIIGCIMFAISCVKIMLEQDPNPSQKIKRILFVLALIVIALMFLNEILSRPVSPPELCMDKEKSTEFEKVYYFRDYGFGSKVYYSFSTDQNVKYDGIKYKKPFKVDSSITISYASCYLKVFWSDVISKEIIVEKNEEKSLNNIYKIEAKLTKKEFFSGDLLTKNDFKVYGITESNDKVSLDEFDFSPYMVCKGNNQIRISYNKLKTEIEFEAKTTKVESIKAEYIGEVIKAGEEPQKQDFNVLACYNNGKEEKIDEYKIYLSDEKENGKSKVSIEYREYKTEVWVPIEDENKDLPIFTNCYKKIEQSNVFSESSVKLQYWQEDKTDIQGQNYKNDKNSLYLRIGDFFNQMDPNGNSGDGNVNVDIHYIINPNYNFSTDKKIKIKGKFVLDSDFKGSDAYTDIFVKVGNQESKKIEEQLTGETVRPIPFEIEVDSNDDEVIMNFECNALGKGLGIGIIFENPELVVSEESNGY